MVKAQAPVAKCTWPLFSRTRKWHFFSLTPSGWPHRRQDHGKGESFSDVNALAKGLQWNWKGTEARFRRLSPDLEPEDKPIILREAPCKERASQTCEVWQMCH